MQMLILFYLFIFMNWYFCKKYQIVNRSVWTAVYPLFLMQESRGVFIEIIFNHGDVFDTNIKIFW